MFLYSSIQTSASLSRFRRAFLSASSFLKKITLKWTMKSFKFVTYPIRSIPEHVANMRAHTLIHFPPAHPNFEAQFQVFSTPKFKLRVIISKILKIVFPYPKRSTKHCWGWHRIFTSFLFLNFHPCVHQFPCEPTNKWIFIVNNMLVFQLIICQNFNTWQCDNFWILFNWIQKWREPTLRNFHMTVHYHQHFTFCVHGTKKSCFHQTQPNWGLQNFYFRQLWQDFVQRF